MKKRRGHGVDRGPVYGFDDGLDDRRGGGYSIADTPHSAFRNPAFNYQNQVFIIKDRNGEDQRRLRKTSK